MSSNHTIDYVARARAILSRKIIEGGLKLPGVHKPLGGTASASKATLLDYEKAIDASEKLAAASKQLYKERLRSIASATGKSDDFNWCVTHPDDVWEALHKVRKPSRTPGNKETKPLSIQTLRASAAAMATLFKHASSLTSKIPGHKKALEGWQELLNESTEEAQMKYENIEPSQRQKEAHIEWDDLVKTRDRLIQAFREDKKDPSGAPDDAYLILSLLTYLPPSRADWGAVKVFRAGNEPAVGSAAEKDLNYVVLPSAASKKKSEETINPPYVCWNRYKTAKTYGRQVRGLPAELAKIVEETIKAREKSGKKTEWLICKKNGEPHNNHGFAVHVSYALNKLFDRPATLDTLRHSFVNHSKIWELTPKQMEALALDLRHSVSMMSRYRLKFDGPAKGGRDAVCDVKCTATTSS